MCSNPSLPSHEIQTEPILVQRTVARNFSGLRLSICFIFDSNQYKWSYPGFTPNEITIYNTLAMPPECNNMNESNFQVTCKLTSCDGSDCIISSLILMFALDKAASFSVIRVGNAPCELASIQIKVKGELTYLVCNSYLEHLQKIRFFL